MTPQQPRTRSSLRGSDRASQRVRATQASREAEYDLLTAALIGMTIGAGMTFLLRRGPGGRRPVSPVLSGMGRGAAWAGRRAGRGAMASARWLHDRGEDAWDSVPRKQIKRDMRRYVGHAREAIDDMVESELHDLRRAIRRQRKRLGV